MDEAAIYEFLARYGPTIEDLTLRVRDLILDNFPTASERLYPTLFAIGYLRPHRRDNWNVLPFFIAPFKSWVNLGFNRGMQMSDPDGVLIGHGQKVRHVQIARVDDIDPAKLLPLLQAAWELE